MLELVSTRKPRTNSAPQPNENRIAFALGGLGGANAHGAGFLHAAQTCDIRPDLISCTSGMIVWAAEYLRGNPIDQLMKKAVQHARPMPGPFDFLNRMRLLLTGMPNVFAPNFLSLATRMFTRMPGADSQDLLDLLFPIDVLKPSRPDSFFEDIADLFNKSETGILFNTFNPETGVEYVHMNEAARALVEQVPDYDYSTTRYKEITAEYVRAALWLMHYGMDRKFHGEVLLDGAYCRQFILRELIAARHVFVARPIRDASPDSVPRNALELEAFKTKLLFSGSYFGEKHFINWLNSRIRHCGHSGSCGHAVDLIEIEIGRNVGFFEFFMEDERLFEAARDKSTAALRNWQEARLRDIEAETRECLCSYADAAADRRCSMAVSR